MDIKPLSIVLIRQDPKSDDCLKCCALMVFTFFADRISKEKIWSKIHVYKKHSGLIGSYFTDLGSFALKNGYNSTIYQYDWHWWNQETAQESTKGKKALIKALKKLKKEKKEWSSKKEVQKEINFLGVGGKFIFKPFDLTILDYYLNLKIPILVSIWAQDIYKDPKADSRHAILITGKKDESYLIIDPDPYFASDKITGSDLEIAMARNGGYMMVLEPKLVKYKIEQERLKF